MDENDTTSKENDNGRWLMGSCDDVVQDGENILNLLLDDA